MNIAVHGLNTNFTRNAYLSFQCEAAEEYSLNNKHINATNHAIQFIFYNALYPLYAITISITNNNFHILPIYVQYLSYTYHRQHNYSRH